MARKTVALPDRFIYSAEFPVLYSDVNAANHLGSEGILPMTLETQLRFLKLMGFGGASAVFEDAGLIMAHSETQYLSEARYMDKLRVDMAITGVKEKSLEMRYRVVNLTRDNETARVCNTLLFFDYQAESVVAVPAVFLETLQKHGGPSGMGDDQSDNRGENSE